MMMLGHNNTKENYFIPSLDLNNQLTIPGRQACTSQPIKFIMNASLIIGAKDATNLRIQKVIGQDIIFMFGETYKEHNENKEVRSQQLIDIITLICQQTTFGQIGKDLLEYLQNIIYTRVDTGRI